MKTITLDELKAIVESHQLFLRNDPAGKRAELRDLDLRDHATYLSGAYLRGAYLRGADLRGAYLRGAYLRGAYLSGADLRGADLRGADLRGAYLRGAYLSGAYLRGADLRGAYLRGADLRGAYLRGAYLSGAYLRGAYLRGAYLRGADLRGAYLRGAYLRGAYLSGADLRGADLRGAKVSEEDLAALRPAFWIVPEVGEFIGWKRCKRDVIVKVRIPENARRTSSLQGRKCRAEFVEVLELQTLDGKPYDKDVAYSQHDGSTEYKVGETVRPDKFDDDVLVECSNGIHFYVTRIEAVQHT